MGDLVHGVIDVSQLLAEVSGTLVSAQASDSGTGTQLGNNVATKGVLIRALSGNTDVIWVGVSGVSSTTGFPLNSLDVIQLPVSNSNLVYILANSGTQKVAYMVA